MGLFACIKCRLRAKPKDKDTAQGQSPPQQSIRDNGHVGNPVTVPAQASGASRGAAVGPSTTRTHHVVQQPQPTPTGRHQGVRSDPLMQRLRVAQSFPDSACRSETTLMDRVQPWSGSGNQCLYWFHWNAALDSWTFSKNGRAAPPEPYSCKLHVPPPPSLADRAPGPVDFKHTALRCPEKEIRLLVLYPHFGCTESPLCCRLVRASLAELPGYAALSYTWGSESPQFPMLLDGSVTYVRENLWLALKHFRRATRFRVMWVDGLCIEQKDLDEKTYQVRLMRDIYQRADRVLAWLGPGTTESDKAIRRMKELYLHCALHMPAGDPGLTAQVPMVDGAFKGCFEHSSWESKRQELSRWCDLLSLPYWGRVWTQQEMSVNLAVEFHCGTSSFNFIDMSSGCLLYKLLEDDLRRGQRDGDEEAPSMRRSRIWSMGRLLSSNELPLKDFLQDGLLATDPRDHVFGVIGISSDAEQLGITADYTKSCQDVYVEVATAYLQHDGLDFLTYAGRSAMQGLPSWVPDWTCPGYLDFGLRETSPRYGGSTPKLQFSVNAAGQHVLALRGAWIGAVKQTGKKMSPSNRPYVDLAVEVLQDCLASVSPKHLGSGDAFQGLFKLLLSGGPRYVISGQETRFDLTPDDMGAYYASFQALNYLMDLPSSPALALPAYFTDNATGPGDTVTRLKRTARLFGESAVASAIGKRFFNTGTHAGQGVDDLEVGDVVCIAYGARIPYVLRPTPTGHFRFIGETYVTGLAQGQAFVGTDAERTFRIV